MSKSKKKTIAQQIMGVAAIAMPAPVRDVVVSRWGARVSLALAGVLIASGVLTLQWTDGKPHVQVNRERAVEVEHKLKDLAETRAEKFQQEHSAKESMTDRWNLHKKQR
jgi:hypothetical protein